MQTITLSISGITVRFTDGLPHKANKVMNREISKVFTYRKGEKGIEIENADLEGLEEVYEKVFPLVVEEVKAKDGTKIEDYGKMFEEIKQADFNQILVAIDDMKKEADELIEKRKKNSR